MIVEYKLIKLYAGVTGMMVPGWVEDGGYFKDPDNYTIIGVVLPETEREYYVPDTINILTREELIIRVLELHSRYPMQMPISTGYRDMTEDEVVVRINDWCNQKEQ